MITIEEIMNSEVRALSWKQPFATLMAHGKVETRLWDTKYRGIVLMCCSKKSYRQYEVLSITGDKQFERIGNTINLSRQYSVTEGKAILIGRLAHTQRMQPVDEDRCFVKYNDKLFCHIYTDVTHIMPFEWKGSQGWRILSTEQKQLIKIAA